MGIFGPNLKEEFYSSNDFEAERTLLSKIEKIKSFKSGSESGNKSTTEEAYKANHEKLVGLIESGAKMIIASGVNPQTPSEKRGFDVIMPTVFFQNNMSLATRVIGASSAVVSDSIWIKSWDDRVTGTKQANVVGQALVGGIVAGGAGAVIGAANAASKNASGGKTVTLGYRVHYYLSLMYSGEAIDAIYISTDLIKQFGPPPTEFVVKKDARYWLIEATRKNQMIGRGDRAIYDEYLAYITKVLKYYKANSKHKGRFAVLH